MRRAMSSDVRIEMGKPTWRQWFWQRMLPLLWLLVSLTALGLAIMCVAWQAQRRSGLSYHQEIIASDMIVTGGYIAAAGNDLFPVAALSVWLLAASLAAGLGVLWLRRRFSLAALLLTVVIAAAAASVPRALLEDVPLHTGYVRLSESSFTRQFLDKKELSEIEKRLAPDKIFARLPQRMRDELNLAPGMLRNVRFEQTPQDSHGRETYLKIDMREDLTREQSATLFHAVSALALEITQELYAPRMQPGVQGSPGGFLSHPNHTHSRFAEYEKEWAASGE